MSSPGPSVPRNIPPRFASQSFTPHGSPHEVDLSALSEEDKAKVLRRHLVSKDQRRPPEPEADESPTRPRILQLPSRVIDALKGGGTTSEADPVSVPRESSEPFPMPFAAAGGDVTCVCLHCCFDLSESQIQP